MGHPYWPIFDLEVRTPVMTLRAVTDELAVELASLASRGVHDPAVMPFSIAWTDLESPERERGALQWHWRNRAELRIDAWRLSFAAIVDGEVIGVTDLAAQDFPTLRQFETGSWLGIEYQGRGFGKEMRVATLTVGFVELHAELALTAAWHDNGPSLGVTRSLGYEPAGTRRARRRDAADEQLAFRMTRAHFMAEVRRDDVEIFGAEPVREMLGIDW